MQMGFLMQQRGRELDAMRELSERADKINAKLESAELTQKERATLRAELERIDGELADRDDAIPTLDDVTGGGDAVERLGEVRPVPGPELVELEMERLKDEANTRLRMEADAREENESLKAQLEKEREASAAAAALSDKALEDARAEIAALKAAKTDDAPPDTKP